MSTETMADVRKLIFKTEQIINELLNELSEKGLNTDDIYVSGIVNRSMGGYTKYIYDVRLDCSIRSKP